MRLISLTDKRHGLCVDRLRTWLQPDLQTTSMLSSSTSSYLLAKHHAVGLLGAEEAEGMWYGRQQSAEVQLATEVSPLSMARLLTAELHPACW